MTCTRRSLRAADLEKALEFGRETGTSLPQDVSEKRRTGRKRMLIREREAEAGYQVS